MASHPHLDDDDDFGGEFPGTHTSRRSGNKRSFEDLEDEEDDIFGSKKANSKVEETAPGVATGMILSLRESLQNCKDTLATCQMDLEAAKAEIQKWYSSFQNESFIPSGTSLEPKIVISYLQSLKSSEESLREQLEKTKKKEAAFIVTFAKREQEIAELKIRDLRVQLKPPSMQDVVEVDGCSMSTLESPIFVGYNDENLVEEKDKKVKELQDNVAAVNFTPQSKMGKMLMSKCRTLQEENEEIGNQANEGKIHELGMKLALQRSQNAELRSQFEERISCWKLLPETIPIREYFLEISFLSGFDTMSGRTLLCFIWEHGMHALTCQACRLCKHTEGLANDVEKSNEMRGFFSVSTNPRGGPETLRANTIVFPNEGINKSSEVIVLQKSLEEKDDEIERLKHELHQSSITEETTTTEVAALDNKVGDAEMLSGEAQTEN
ncbi:unnamed protein product [Camellia sinensis]